MAVVRKERSRRGTQVGSGARRQSRTTTRSEQWRELIAEWAGGQQSQRDFCRERRINPGSFQWWRWWLKKFGDQGRAGDPGQAVAVAHESGMGNSLFVPVRVVEPKPVLPPRDSACPRDGLELVLAGSCRRVFIRGDFDAAVLAKIITVAEGMAG